MERARQAVVRWNEQTMLESIEKSKKRPPITCLGIIFCLFWSALFVPQFITFFAYPEVGDTAVQVREKMGIPVSIHREPGWWEYSPESGWYDPKSDKCLSPEKLPSIVDARWYYQVGILNTSFFLLDFENGKVCRIFLGST